MPNQWYPKGKEAVAGDLNLDTADLRVVWVDSGYAYNAAHDALDDVGAGTRVVVTALASTSITDGVLDAADVLAAALTGDPVAALIIYEHTGTDSTSRLLLFIDTADGLPYTPSGVDAPIVWNANGIAAL